MYALCKGSDYIQLNGIFFLVIHKSIQESIVISMRLVRPKLINEFYSFLGFWSIFNVCSSMQHRSVGPLKYVFC